jgi:hypothetical protein
MAFGRSYGTGQLYEASGSYYGRWGTPDGRKLNRRIGRVRAAGSADGLTRAQAERAFRKMQVDADATPSRPRTSAVVTVSEAADSLRRA